MVRPAIRLIAPKYVPFFMYAAMLFFVIIGDGVMSYMVPVIMDNALGSATLMGVILATSSMFGMFFDFFFSKSFPTKKSLFFSKIMLAAVVLFPLSFFLFRSIPTFVFAMFIWGLYYEAMVFSNFHAVHEYVNPAQHLWAWGALVMVKDVAWVIGPFLAATLDGSAPQRPLFAALAAYGVGIMLFFVRFIFIRSKATEVSGHRVEEKHSLREEIGIWRTYGKAIWPLLLLMLLFFLIDASFFSIGPVFAEFLHSKHPLGNLFVTMYTVPTAIFILATGIMAKRFGKKRSAFLSGVFAGLGLIIMSRTSSVMGILISTFIASIGLGVLYPELMACFEDYVSRAKKYGNDIVGLTAIMGSIGYVVGPIVNGFLSDRIGAQNVFGMWGAVLAVFSLCAFVIVRRKIRLPQSAVEQVVSKIAREEKANS